jgi:hypothetical protein
LDLSRVKAGPAIETTTKIVVPAKFPSFSPAHQRLLKEKHQPRCGGRLGDLIDAVLPLEPNKPVRVNRNFRVIDGGKQ